MTKPAHNRQSSEPAPALVINDAYRREMHARHAAEGRLLQGMALRYFRDKRLRDAKK